MCGCIEATPKQSSCLPWRADGGSSRAARAQADLARPATAVRAGLFQIRQRQPRGPQAPDEPTCRDAVQDADQAPGSREKRASDTDADRTPAGEAQNAQPARFTAGNDDGRHEATYNLEESRDERCH